MPVAVLSDSALDLLADVFDRLADLATGLAEAFLSLTERFVIHAFLAQPFIVGQVAGGLLGFALDFAHLALELVLIPHSPPPLIHRAWPVPPTERWLQTRRDDQVNRKRPTATPPIMKRTRKSRAARSRSSGTVPVTSS